MKTLGQYPLSTGDCYDVVLCHLRQQRDQADKLISYLEELKAHRARNTHVVTNPEYTGAAQPPLSTMVVMSTIGDEPKPPKLLVEPQ